MASGKLRPSRRSHHDPGDLVAGDVVTGRYRVVRRVGGGAYGEVYEVEHIALQKRFALKLLNAQASTNWRQISRFQQEAIAASKIDHPNIVTITDVGATDAGRAFYVMELLYGHTLAQVLHRSGVLSVSRAIPILAATCHAVHAAHQAGVVHRDLKPDNIFLVPEEDVQSGVRREVVRILDFGLAKVLESPGLTVEGIAYGTPGYMAPEQIMGKEADRRADVYSIGCIAFELFAGRQPFTGSPIEVAVAHCEQPIPDLGRYDGGRTPPRMRALIERCLAKDLNNRYPSCAELLSELRLLAVELLTPDGFSRELDLPPEISAEIDRARTSVETDDAGWWDEFGTITGRHDFADQLQQSRGEPVAGGAGAPGQSGIAPADTEPDLEVDDGEDGRSTLVFEGGSRHAAAVAAMSAQAMLPAPDGDPFALYESTINVKPRPHESSRVRRRLTRSVVIVWTALLVVGVLTFLGVYSFRGAGQVNNGVLVITVDPPGATVRVDGVEGPAEGRVRVVNDLAPHEVTISASHGGCHPLQRRVEVEAGRAAKVELKLECGR